MPPHISLTHSHKGTTTCHQFQYCTTTNDRHLLALWLCVMQRVGCNATGNHTGSVSLQKQEQTQAWLGASRWAEECWHFLDGAQKAVSSHITSQYTTHRGACITHPMWLCGEGSPSMADKLNKSADQEAGKKGRWPGRFVWVGHSVIIIHGCLGRNTTLPVSQYLAGNCCEEGVQAFSQFPYPSFHLGHCSRAKWRIKTVMIWRL